MSYFKDPSPDKVKDLINRTTYRPSIDKDRQNAHAEVREQIHETMYFLAGVCPDSRELSLALTKLEEAMFWGNAALARIDKDGARR